MNVSAEDVTSNAGDESCDSVTSEVRQGGHNPTFCESAYKSDMCDYEGVWIHYHLGSAYRVVHVTVEMYLDVDFEGLSSNIDIQYRTVVMVSTEDSPAHPHMDSSDWLTVLDSSAEADVPYIRREDTQSLRFYSRSIQPSLLANQIGLHVTCGETTIVNSPFTIGFSTLDLIGHGKLDLIVHGKTEFHMAN